MTLTNGTRVGYDGGHTTYYGTITGRRKNDTYQIRWDDGSGDPADEFTQDELIYPIDTPDDTIERLRRVNGAAARAYDVINTHPDITPALRTALMTALRTEPLT